MPSASLAFLVATGSGLELICRAPGCGAVKGYAAAREDTPAELTVLGLALRFGEQTTLKQLARKVVCPACGSKSFDLEPWDESATRKNAPPAGAEDA